MTSQDLKVQVKLTEVIAPTFYDLHWDIIDGGHTYYKLSGGRGSTKSSFISVEIILGMMEDGNAGNMTNAIAYRRYKDNLHDSVFEQLLWAIDKLGVSHLWKATESPLKLTYIPTGQVVLFRGADKVKKSKSIKVRVGYIKYLWFEEVDEFEGPEKIRSIRQSVVRGGVKFTVFYSYNPPQSQRNWVNDPVEWNRPDTLEHHSTYLTVPAEWLGEQFIIDAEHLKATKPEAYKHEYLGEVTGTGAEVFLNLVNRKITDEEIEMFFNIKRGLDFGYASDPLSYVVVEYNRKYKRLYIFHELHQVRVTNYKAAEHIKEENKDNELVRADSAEPKSINEISQYGVRIAGVKKGPDSVDYGIKFLQDLNEIIIDSERCPNTWREFYGYELERDANGNLKADYPDKDNHSIDGVRYSLNDECIKFMEDRKNIKKADPNWMFNKPQTQGRTDLNVW